MTDKKKNGKFRPNWRRQAVLAGLAVIAIGIGYGVGFWFKPPVEKTAPVAAPATVKPWYQTQAPPPQLVTGPTLPLFPDNHDDAKGPARPYEESLPREIYVPPPRIVAKPAPSAVAATPPVPAPKASPPAPFPKPADPAPTVDKAPSPLETAALPVVPKAWSGAEPPPWRKYAVTVPSAEGRPRVAIVIDDMGIDRKHSAEAVTLPGPLTLSFLTYADDLEKVGPAARAAGHELMLHVAMEPQNITLDPGPNVLMVAASEAENLRRLTWGLDRFSGYVGVNNHMGSKFTRDMRGMTVVMAEMKRRGLLFLDSRTAGGTVGADLAHRFGVPFAERNIFLDNLNTVDYVRDRLAELEALAVRRGFAIAIGHPKEATIRSLREWLPKARERGVVLVPLSALVTHPDGSG